MKPYFGALNDKSQYWDGKNWCNLPKKDDSNEHLKYSLKMYSKQKEYFNDGCHLDGVFECPRCRRTHNLVDNFDFLCDGCVDVLLTHPLATKEMLDGIYDFRNRAKLHWCGKRDSEIDNRILLRNGL